MEGQTDKGVEMEEMRGNKLTYVENEEGDRDRVDRMEDTGDSRNEGSTGVDCLVDRVEKS